MATCCFKCGAAPGEGQKFKLCNGCKAGEHSAQYCSRECQVAHWREHGKSCARLSTIPHTFEWGTHARKVLEQFGREFETGRQYLENPLTFDVDRMPEKLIADCALFIAVVAQVASKGSATTVSVGGVNSLVRRSTKRERRRYYIMLPRPKGKSEKLEVRYLVPEHGAARSLISGMFTSCGQWLAGPDSRKRYLGMSDAGPVRLGLGEWERRLREGLQAEIEVYIEHTQHKYGQDRADLVEETFKEQVMPSIDREGWYLGFIAPQ